MKRKINIGLSCVAWLLVQNYNISELELVYTQDNLLKTNQGSCTPPKVYISCFQAIKGIRNYNSECENVKGIVLKIWNLINCDSISFNFF